MALRRPRYLAKTSGVSTVNTGVRLWPFARPVAAWLIKQNEVRLDFGPLLNFLHVWSVYLVHGVCFLFLGYLQQVLFKRASVNLFDADTAQGAGRFVQVHLRRPRV